MRLVALVGLGLAACAAAPGLDEAMRAYEARAEACRAAPGEAARRDCILHAAEAELIPALPVDIQAGYRRLLAEDRRLDAEVAAGRLSRAERTARIDAETARLLGQWRHEAALDRRSRAEADEMDALQRRLAEIDDLVRRGRR